MTARDARHRLEYAAVMVVRGVVRVLPDVAVRGLGTLLGLVFYALDGGHRAVSISQLRSAFPVKSAAECRAIARATFAHFGRSLVMLLKFSTRSAEEIRARVEYEGIERMRTALAEGRGVLLFSGHFGFWEVFGLAHALALPPMSVVARPLDNPYLDALLDRMRRSTGNRVIYRRGAVRRILRALAGNEACALLIDQHIQSTDAVAVEFFDRPAATSSAVAALALRTGAPLIPFFALPLPRGRYRIVYEPPVDLPPADAADPIRELTQRCTDVLEMYVRRHPQLWLWMHRRWRNETGASVAPEMFPSAAEGTDDEQEAPGS